MTNDLDLLAQFSRDNSQDAFAALVNRHVNLVYSAALRQVRSSQLAEEVAQSVFTDLAHSAGKLKPDTLLTAWLYQVARRTAIDVVRRESRRQWREQIAAEMNPMNATAADWTQIEPLLDEAMDALDGPDRAAVLLRYFENKSFREVGQAFGSSEDAAQKRVSRAVDRLREFFTKRNVAVGTGGLAVLISANAVQAAPAGLAATISTTAVLAGTAVSTSTVIAATKAITMTTIQKLFVTATVAVLAGTGIYEARQVSTLRSQVQSLQQQQAPLAGHIRQLQRERDEATSQLAGLQQENADLRQNTAELLKLRGEIARLRGIEQSLAQSKTYSPDSNDPFTQSVLALSARATELNQYLEQRPDKKIPELRLLGTDDWLRAAQDARFDTDANVRKALSKLRSLAKNKLPIGSALYSFTRANNGQLPTDLSQLAPFLRIPLDDAILERYTLVHGGNLGDLPPGAWLVIEKAPVDKDYDSRAKFGNGTSTIISTGIGEAGDPDDKSY